MDSLNLLSFDTMEQQQIDNEYILWKINLHIWIIEIFIWCKFDLSKCCIDILRWIFICWILYFCCFPPNHILFFISKSWLLAVGHDEKRTDWNVSEVWLKIIQKTVQEKWVFWGHFRIFQEGFLAFSFRISWSAWNRDETVMDKTRD